jgi:hypothetical protein
MTTREIVWSPKDRDYALRLNGELVGFARSYAEGERVLDELISEQVRHAPTLTRTSQERLSLYTTAYRTAKAAGRDLDAACYQAEALQALADSLGMTVEQMLADRRELRAQEVA